MRITRRAFSVQLSAFVLLLLAGCALWPSTWRVGKTPLEKAQERQERAAAANHALLQQTQRDLHQAEHVFAQAPASRPVSIGRGLLADARASLDQAIGAPAAAEDAGWRELAMRLVSDNIAVQIEAQRELDAQRRETAAVSDRAARAVAAAWEAKQEALAYAADREQLADFAAKLKLGFYGLVALIVLGTVLSVVARFFPAVGLAAKVVNGVVTPGITWAAQRAEEGLQRVGAGMARLRTSVGDIAETLIEQNFDAAVTAPDHRRLIAAGAAAAGNPPPST